MENTSYGVIGECVCEVPVGHRECRGWRLYQHVHTEIMLQCIELAYIASEQPQYKTFPMDATGVCFLPPFARQS